jgi:hypothetical protein
MLFLTVALHPEARPFIARFRLRQDTGFHAVPVYRSDAVWLAVSGVGRVKAAVAAACLLARAPSLEAAVALNIGIAGSTRAPDAGLAAVGDLFLIHKIVEQTTGRAFFPDMLIRADLPEAVLTTVDRPLDRAAGMAVEEGLVDMEAAGFFQAVASFLPPHRIACLKIVSDFLETRRFDRAWVSRLVEARMDDIDRVIQRYETALAAERDVLEEAHRAALNGIRAALRLTAGQYKMLTDAARAYKLRNGTPLPDLSGCMEPPVSTKQEGKHRFEQLRRLLLDASLLPPLR